MIKRIELNLRILMTSDKNKITHHISVIITTLNITTSYYLTEYTNKTNSQSAIV